MLAVEPIDANLAFDISLRASQRFRIPPFAVETSMIQKPSEIPIPGGVACPRTMLVAIKTPITKYLLMLLLRLRLNLNTKNASNRKCGPPYFLIKVYPHASVNCSCGDGVTVRGRSHSDR